MQDIIDHPDWGVATDGDYARWYQTQPVDPASLYRDPRVAYALEVGLIEPPTAARYLPPPV